MGGDWRATIRRHQREVLLDGATVVSGTGPYGNGGLGRHLMELVEALRDTNRLCRYMTPHPRADDSERAGIAIRSPGWWQRTIVKLPPFRYSFGWRTRFNYTGFDAVARRLLPAHQTNLLAFNGAALQQMRAARRLGYQSVGLISANGHLKNVVRQHDKAWRQYPIERPWGPTLEARNLTEYRTADLVWVPSRYVWSTFVNEGFPEERLRLFRLTPDDRFQPRVEEPTAPTFDVVFTGSLRVHKGVPLLIDSFRRLPHKDLRLKLVGGWGSRGMRRFVTSACAEDRRITVCPGDPLPHLLQAGVYAHVSYEEGCTYAPAEAAACGVPLILTEDSSMVTEYVPGLVKCRVVPTGDADAITEAIDAAYRGNWV